MSGQSASVYAELRVVTASAQPQQLIGALEHRSSAADHCSSSTGGHAAHAFALPVSLPSSGTRPKTQYCVLPNVRVLCTAEKRHSSLRLTSLSHFLL